MWQSLDLSETFDGERHAVERPQRLTAALSGIQFSRVPEYLVAVEVHESVEVGVDRLDPRARGLSDLLGGERS